MNPELTAIEKRLIQAQARCQGIQLLRDTAILGIVLCACLLCLGVSLEFGLITSKKQALAWLGSIGAGGLITWMALIARMWSRRPTPERVAATLEDADKQLEDRLNTLLFLQRKPEGKPFNWFGPRLSRQLLRLMKRRAAATAFPVGGALTWLSAFVLLLAADVWLNQNFKPWTHLQATSHVRTVKGPASGPSLPVALSATNGLDQSQPWGEVRITDPAADLRLTKVDVLPLAIETAANRPLKTVAWYSSVNGIEETSHELPAPTDSHYAVYQPTIYLDELGLSDWDVVTYYARANTDPQNSYASEVYFLEIRPFREDILKMPGGEGGKPYQTLGEMSSLVTRQQQVIRETHQHVQRPPEQKARDQDRQKLAQAEGDLGNAAEHLYAEMASKMENKPIGDALDNLDKAQASLRRASALLQSNIMTEAQERERAALTELVAARKIFQRAVTDHPGDFNDPQHGDASPVADSSKKMQQMAEFRDEAKSAQDFVQKTAERQKQLQQQARASTPEQSTELSSQQDTLRNELADFQGQHPRAFKGAEAQSNQALESMRNTAEKFRHQDPASVESAGQAAQQLDQLKSAMQARGQSQQLVDAYKLKDMLDGEIRMLQRDSTSSAPDSSEQLARTAEAAQQTIEQLQKAVDQQQGGAGFGQSLRDALHGEKRVALDEKLANVPRAQTEQERRDRAAEAGTGLEQLSQAFAVSQPKPLAAARLADALRPARENGLGPTLAQLHALVKELESHRKISPIDRAKQSRQLMSDAEEVLRNQFGQSQRGTDLRQGIDRMLAQEASPDAATLSKWITELESLSAETRTQMPAKGDVPALADIDPAHLPPAYRDRIEKYFRKLSEK